MGVSVSVSVSVPLTMVDAGGNGTILQVAVSPGRTAGELKLALTPDELTSIAANGGAVYLMGADLNAAGALLAQAAQIATPPPPPA